MGLFHTAGINKFSDANWKNKIKEGFKSIVEVDLRSLALLRICIAITLLTDLIIRFSDLGAHYTNAGILPLEALFRYAWDSAYFSIYTIAVSWPLQALLFLINFICVCCLLAGYRTRLFTVVCWLFLLSLHNRNPLVQQAGDDLLRLILFWGMFLPWGYYYSIDAGRTANHPLKPIKYYSLAGLAYVLQIFSVYFFSAMLKTSAEWTSEFTALYYALSLDQIRMPFGTLIYPYEGLLYVLTMSTYYVEMLLPFLLLMPFLNAYFRIIFISIIGIFQLGIALSLNVGLFPLISIIAMVGLIPRFIIGKIDQKLRLFFCRLKPHLNFLIQRLKKLPEAAAYIPKESIIKRVFVVFFIAYTFAWNLRTIKVPINYSELNWVGNFLRIDQYWSMFAPSVFKDDGWFILKGRTEAGETFDILQEGQAISYKRPPYIAGTFKNDRWRKYSENILFVSKSHYRTYYCNYLLRQWNKLEDKKINYLEIVYMKIPSLPGYKEAGPTKELLCTCSSK